MMKFNGRVAALVSALVVAGVASLAGARMGPEGSGYKAKFPMSWTYADSPAKFAELQKLVGKRAPALKTSAWIGDNQDMAALKGKIVLIDFWATWCGPCIAAIPHTNEVARKYEDKGVVVFGVCNTRGSDKMPSTVKSKGMKYPTAADVNDATAQAYGVQ